MTRLIRNNRGQVAIFVALMFQVLFLFFAMIVNVGLLVHHKINLQNSVDLAAYYGASKQAEVLNAISHVNYQIRQSWKLLVWRQKVLGTAGAKVQNVPIFPGQKVAANLAVNETMAGGADPYQKIFQRPSFCITYAPHELQNGPPNTTENTCKGMYENVTKVTLPTASVLSIPGFFNFGKTVANAITAAAASAFQRCNDTGAMNFIMASRFVIAHDIDADERATLMNYLATGLSADETNFYELSGDEVNKGLEKTLKKNLTDANGASIQYELYNSLGAPGCKSATATAAGASPPKWLVPIRTYPVWRYIDCDNNAATANGEISTQARHLVDTQAPAKAAFATAPLPQAVEDIKAKMYIRPTLIGFEKDPWCVPYVGVRATAKPKIPFMPLSDIEITAQAYAKPFGGRIGPWYVRDWPQAVAGSAREAYKAYSKSPDMVDGIGSVRVQDVGGITSLDDDSWAPNVSRFPGDQLGFSSERVVGFFHDAIQGIVPPSPFPARYLALTPTTPTYPFPVNPVAEHVSLRYYDDIAIGYSTPGARDQLSWDKIANAAPRLRLLEIAALAPTIFDLAYYSIDPDFYHNYYLPIQNHIAKRGGYNTAEHVILGDYGWRADTQLGQQMNIFDQIRIQRDVGAVNALNSDTTMPYVVKKSSHLLNSWSVDNLLDYNVNSTKFGECFSPSSTDYETPMNPPTPGNCVDGGRVGNSVKLVSKEWLKATDLELGGNGITGAIRNPPPW